MKYTHIIVLISLLSTGAFSITQIQQRNPTKMHLTADAPLYQLPSDIFQLSQQSVDTYAWQLFVALNWKAASYPGKPDSTQTFGQFGEPGDFNLSVWQSYKDAHDVFSNTVPGPWQTATLTSSNQHQRNVFRMISKVDHRVRIPNKVGRLLSANSGNDQVEDIMQAKGTWLTDQTGQLIWYEVRLNEDEFNYIVRNKLYNADAQIQYAQKNGIWLPDGTDGYGQSGTIEIKAAWRVIPADQLNQYQNRYKIVKGMIPSKVVVRPDTTIMANYQPAYLGLVGLHIIRKTPNLPQFVWSTFEHVDLAPIEGQPVDPSKSYVLFNKNCPTQCNDSIPGNCYANRSPQPGKDSLTTPVQVLRCRNTIPNDPNVDQVNQFFQQKISAANPNSVFQYYRLVSAQWPQSAVSDPDAPAPTATPLPTGGITPLVLGNLASETYALNVGCMSCHQYGNSLANNGNNTIASDYSFLFSLAQRFKLGASARPSRKAVRRL